MSLPDENKEPGLIIKEPGSLVATSIEDYYATNQGEQPRSEELRLKFYDDFLFTYEGYSPDLKKIPDNMQLRVAPMGYLDEMCKNPVDCNILIINPNSDNQYVVMQYVDELCNKLVNTKNLFVHENKDCYDKIELPYMQDLYNLYFNGEINMNWNFGILPSGFYSDFLKGKVSVDEFVSEFDRVFKAYINE